MLAIIKKLAQNPKFFSPSKNKNPCIKRQQNNKNIIHKQHATTKIALPKQQQYLENVKSRIINKFNPISTRK
jgi:hypothetical protein